MIISDLVSEQARSNPDRTAYIFRDNPITFADLERRVEACAHGLATRGVGRGDAVAILVRNCPEFVILAMALSRIGAVAVPINFLEKPDRIALILNDAKVVAALTAREFLRPLRQASKSVPTLKHIFLRDGTADGAVPFAELERGGPSAPPPSRGDENDLVLLLYTSGTTGAPKGVMLTNHNLLANTDQCLRAIDLKPSDRFICVLPMFHSFAWTTCVLIPLRLGASCVINESLLPFDPVVKAIWKHKVTLFVAVPQIYSALSAKIRGAKALVLRFLNPIRLCISGAAPLPAAIHDAFEKTFGVPLLEGYGLTETSPVVSLNPQKKRKVGTVGLPLPGVDVSIRDDEGAPVDAGAVGEIWIRGENVMGGYFERADETAAVLTNDGWLKSGDMGRFDEDGYLRIVDRKKDLIIVKGLNVYPQEVESAIIRHPAVGEVAVVGTPDPETGEEKIRAFYTVKPGEKVDGRELSALCRESLAPFKRPKEFIRLDELPKNALQKVLKKDLRNY